MRLLFESEKIKMMKTYELILKKLPKKYLRFALQQSLFLYPLEISKKFGSNYIQGVKRSYHKHLKEVEIVRVFQGYCCHLLQHLQAPAYWGHLQRTGLTL